MYDAREMNISVIGSQWLAVRSGIWLLAQSPMRKWLIDCRKLLMESCKWLVLREIKVNQTKSNLKNHKNAKWDSQ
jgi:hypothetical protein